MILNIDVSCIVPRNMPAIVSGARCKIYRSHLFDDRCKDTTLSIAFQVLTLCLEMVNAYHETV